MLQFLRDVMMESAKENSTIYIYPCGGADGIKAYSILENLYQYQNVVGVDNGLCNGTSILSLKEAAERFDENDILLLASINPDICGSIRLPIVSNIPAKRVRKIPVINCSDKRNFHLELTAEEIYANRVQGSVAEAGVYKGEFAKVINLLFPDRNLYLFDSFEGFNISDVYEEYDNTIQTDDWIKTLRDTSENLVLGKMKYAQRVKIVKGFIPETLQNIQEDEFAFVNLDMDLYFPTYEALKWFWPRLSKGGSIFVHDYCVWDGITSAVRQFSAEYDVGYVRLSDGATVSFSKGL